MIEPIPSAVRELIELFSTSLASVKFPDCDETALTALTEAVEQASSEVAEAEARCGEARRLLGVAEEVLLQRAARAHAYARIYAEGDSELARQVESISIPRTTRRPLPTLVADSTAPKRRARVAKSEPLLGVLEEAQPADCMSQ